MSKDNTFSVTVEAVYRSNSGRLVDLTGWSVPDLAGLHEWLTISLAKVAEEADG